jgi:hypothetical protein
MKTDNLPPNDVLLFPWERGQVKFWTEKWGITKEQLNEAIVQTGSIRISEIRKYLIRKGTLFSYTEWFRNMLGKRFAKKIL